MRFFTQNCAVCEQYIRDRAANCAGCGALVHAHALSTCAACENEVKTGQACCTYSTPVPCTSRWSNMVDSNDFVCVDCVQGDW